MTIAHQPTTSDAWPELPLAEWRDTYGTLHRWLQIVGKTRLALAPAQNHWWHVTLYLTSRGLTTSPMPVDGSMLEIELDFIDHRLVASASDGGTHALALAPRSVADFYDEYTAMLRALGVELRMRPVPVEITDDVTPFPDDRTHASYDPDAAQRCLACAARRRWRTRGVSGRIPRQIEPVALLLGLVRSRVHTLLRPARSRSSGRRSQLSRLRDS